MSSNVDDLRAFAEMARGGCCEGGRCNSTEKRAKVPAEIPVSHPESTAHITKSIIDEAKEVMSVDRQKSYGHPLENHQRIASFWNTFLGDKLIEPITPREAAWMMLLVKPAREINCPKRDNLVDVVGYAAVIEVIDQAQAQS